MMTLNQDKGIANHILKYWVIYVFLGGIVANYVLNSAKIDQIDYRVTQVEAEQMKSSDILLQMRLDVAVIKNNVEEIKKKIQ